jgi:hypothetical protein
MKETNYMPPLAAELQQVIDLYHLPEREIAARLNITRHEYRKRLNRATKIIGPHARCIVADGACI